MNMFKELYNKLLAKKLCCRRFWAAFVYMSIMAMLTIRKPLQESNLYKARRYKVKKKDLH
jgi:hypothetical protein